MKLSLNGAWTLYYEEHNKLNADYFTQTELQNSGMAHVPATVPGNFEIDLERAGVIEDVFFGENPIHSKYRENLHLWFTRTFTAPADGDWELVFEGIDTYAEIYLNGQKLGRTENMFIAHRFTISMLPGENELVVHILPAMIEARKYPITAGVIHHQEYNAGGLMTRKAQHMYGWDIMPRILSGGLWRGVFLQKKKPERIADHYLRTVRVGEKKASLRLYYEVDVTGDIIQEYSLRVTGVCKDSRFEKTFGLWHTSGNLTLDIQDPYLWWTKDMGDPDLYDVTLELLRGENVIDTTTTEKLSSTRINKWLTDRGLVTTEKIKTVTSKTVYKPSALAVRVGICEEEFVDKKSGEIKTQIKLSESAQLFIIENLENIIETT